MPIKHAALVQLRKDKKRHQRNRMILSELRTLTKQLTGLLRQQKTDEAREMLKRVSSRYERAALKGVVHRNTASRTTSRLAKRLNAAVK